MTWFEIIVISLGIISIARGLLWLVYFFKTKGLLTKEFPLYKTRGFCEEHGDRSPKIFILAPVLNEQATITAFLRQLRALDYERTKYEVVVITTEREVRGLGFQKSTAELVDDFLLAVSPPNFRRIHYSNPWGNKADQLNFAFKEIRKHLPEKELETTFFCVYDADSLVPKQSLKILASAYLRDKETEVFQQPHLWLKNYNHLPNSLTGWLMRGFCLLHTFYTLSYELNMIRRPYRFPYQMKYCMGHGLYVKGSVLEKLRGFPEVVEDQRLGFRCSLLKIKIGLLPVFGVVQAATNLTSWIKQASVWFTGSFLVIGDFRKVESMIGAKNYPYAIWILAYRIVKNLVWMNYGLWFIISLLTGIVTNNHLILGMVMVIVVIKMWLPSLIILKNANRLLAPYGIDIQNSLLSNIPVILATPFLFSLSFLGPYLGVFRLLGSKMSGVTPLLPKTAR